MRRFRIAEDSMLPTLRPGDVVVATATPRPVAGWVVVFPHPRRGLWLVKRVVAVDGSEMWVESDNPTATLADSRTLGWLPTDGAYRARMRLRGGWRPGRIPRPTPS